MLPFRSEEHPMSDAYHLAQINLARMIAPIDDPLMAAFVAQLGTINALADRSPGFVWRLKSASGNATDLRPSEDPRVFVNMSVWESFESLQAYVYRSAHVTVMRDRKRWFERYEGPYYALWWIPRGHVPTVEEGQQRVRTLAERGPSVDAFWFGAPYPAPDEAPGDASAGAFPKP
jgi:hypothetical protein